MPAQVTRWGNSLGVRIPKDLAARLGLSDGAQVDMVSDGDRIVLTLATKPRRYRLEDLLVGMTPEAMHTAFDWGPDLGREDVP